MEAKAGMKSIWLMMLEQEKLVLDLLKAFTRNVPFSFTKYSTFTSPIKELVLLLLDSVVEEVAVVAPAADAAAAAPAADAEKKD
jgi:hypothetical protein